MKKLKVAALVLLLIIVIVFLIPVAHKSFSELFKGEARIQSSLEKFRQIPLKTIKVEGVNWQYLTVGQGNETLLFLHGMGGAYDIWWQQIEKLKADYRIISLSLPEVHSLAATATGINAILEVESIDKFTMIGSSMGGYISQYYAQKYPAKINRLVVGNSFPPNHLLKKENASMRKALPFIPAWVIMKMFRGNLKEKVVPASEDSPLVEAYLLEQYYGMMSKGQFIGRMDVVLDYFEPNLSEAFKTIPKLIIEADNDPLIKPVLQQKIKELYPEAEIYTFKGKGHFEYLNAADEYTNVLQGFLINKEELAVSTAVKSYFRGRKRGDISLLSSVFHPSARLLTKGKGTELKIIPLTDYLQMVEGAGAQKCKTEILSLTLDDDMATAHTSFIYEEKTYNDYLTLYKLNGRWLIVNKTFVEK